MSDVVRAMMVPVLIAAAPVAQAKPDFSGEWVLNRQASTLPPVVSNVESGVVRIEHREPEFRFHRTYVIAGTSRDAEYSIRTDGAEEAQTGPQGLPTTTTLRWDGSALVLAMRVAGPGYIATNDVRYELLDGGRRLRATEVGRAPQHNHDAVWIYDRR
jgi:hypothetical protein